jgi:ABC-type maltose transport system permease subunit
MAPAMARSGRRWRLPVVLAIVSAFVLIEALGLCNTFGQLTLA